MGALGNFYKRQKKKPTTSTKPRNVRSSAKRASNNARSAARTTTTTPTPTFTGLPQSQKPINIPNPATQSTSLQQDNRPLLTPAVPGETGIKPDDPRGTIGGRFLRGASLEKPKGGVVSDPGNTDPIYAAGLLSNVLPISTAIEGVSKGTSLVAKLAKVGTKGKISTAFAEVSNLYSTNTKSIAQTANWLQRLSPQLTKPKLVAGVVAGVATAGVISSIGSYPFAGFLKEEALQTLGFAMKTAEANNDFEGTALAIQEQEEILDPNLWNQILNNIPYVNVLNSLTGFYKSARIKLEIDKTSIAIQQEKIATGQTEDEIIQGRIQAGIDRRAQEQIEDDARIDKRIAEAAQREIDRNKRTDERTIANNKLFDERGKAQAQAKIDAQNKAWEEQDKRYAKIAKEAAERREAERLAEAEFWLAYAEEQEKKRQESAPSKLNFGIV